MGTYTHGTPWTVKVSNSRYESVCHHLQSISEAQAINGDVDLQPALLWKTSQKSTGLIQPLLTLWFFWLFVLSVCLIVWVGFGGLVFFFDRIS